jgi:uncharacterized protein
VRTGIAVIPNNLTTRIANEEMMSESPVVIDNTDENQLEIQTDGHVAYLSYDLAGNRLRLIHTEVPAELQGRGYANTLVRFALERAQRDGLHIVPICPFVRTYLKRHPEWAELVATTW